MEKIKKIYCDFDGTITKKDAVNSFFELYAHKDWLKSEALWIEGKITSRQNAINQVQMLQSVSEKQLLDFINSIEIDDYFLEFLELIKEKNIEFTVLSDGFDLFIEKVFKRHNIQGVNFFANHLVYKNNKFSIEFPYYDEKCKIGAGMCKCRQIKEKDFCYIGDGTSDLCVARGAKILFASKNLLNFCENNNINHIPFKTFRDIINEVKDI